MSRDLRFGSLTVPDEGAYPSYNSLVGAFEQGQLKGVMTKVHSADALAHLAWAIIHGLVSLELAGYVDPALSEARFRESVAMFVRAILVDPTKLDLLLVD